MATSGHGGGQLPRLQLDQLLDELQLRIDEVRGTRDRVHSLLEAVLTVGRELDLRQVLRRIVEAAVVLVDAEYGALGVIEPGERLAQFIPVGISVEEYEQIGPLPQGHGVLGELIRHPEALRIHQLQDHPSSYGFPANHPPMHSFLGVPIRVRDEVFGNLYLTEKRGAKEFDGEDEAVLSTLAVAAGVAIENARLYEEARRRQRWIEASAEVTNTLLSGAQEQEVLGLMLDRARSILRADLGTVSLPAEGADELRIVLAQGTAADGLEGRTLPMKGTLSGAAFTRVELAISDDMAGDERVRASVLPVSGIGPAVAVPLGTSDGLRGVLLVGREPGGERFGPEETDALVGFAGQAAVAMELAQRRRDAEQLALFEDRDRIARDLHDLAIQRLFATGMTLQSALRFVTHEEGTERLLRAVDDLDETIKIIRTTIFGLRRHERGATAQGLRLRVLSQVKDSVATLGFTPALRTEGLLDTDVPAPVADHLVAVLGEALSNAARHAGASSVDITVIAGQGLVALTVTDDGRGLPPGGRRSGLANIAERARELGGELTLDPPAGGGTRLVWRVPLDRRAAQDRGAPAAQADAREDGADGTDGGARDPGRA
ncbi:GAF domain-containing protein [Streptomyces sp. WMMC500]|uniref:sensor histidine kinase n=1 Tax=Streptomyces sp. WMMC500 TaxID=3015154 RepID=UPI00248ABFD9|nr:GAF domain-containing protein [Streptomyces sp. WMMC500]WBB62932.1 GAF domain-containing protein [Streptomyces sp. WMMC500]